MAFMEILGFRPNLELWTLYVLQKYFKNTGKNEPLLANMIFENLRISNIDAFGECVYQVFVMWELHFCIFETSETLKL